MIKIFTVEEAQKSILRRDMALEPHVPSALQASLDRLFGHGATPETAVSHILRDVRAKGDAALRDWTLKIDGVQMPILKVDPADIETAVSRISPELADALRFAASRIRQFHDLQPLPNWTTNEMGGTLGQRVTPIKRVGVYVPGGTAPLPSSLLMSVIPAQVAGVAEIIVATPPDRETGKVADVILAAAAICGIDTVIMLGGAQAIAAMAFGTESVPRVDKVVGAGGLFTTLAKRQVYGIVGIDGLYGPTETAVVADDSANPAWVAADLLAQAEHDVLATAVLFTPSRAFAEAVQIEIGKQLEDPQPRRHHRPIAQKPGRHRAHHRPRRSVPTRQRLSPPNTPASPPPTPKPTSTKSQMPADCSSASAALKCWAITWLAPATSCPPAVPPASPRRSTCWTSSKSPASSSSTTPPPPASAPSPPKSPKPRD